MSTFDLQELRRFEGTGSLVYRDVMPSTSDVARETLAQNPNSDMPLLVLCDLQTDGRGQPGKTWKSDSASLTFTWCIEEKSIPPTNQPLLPLIAGACVCEAISSLGIAGAKLKWPNDVLIDRKKVCGILVEKISAGQHASFLIGIGINVNQSDAAALQTNRSQQFPPSSLKMNCGQSIDIQRLLSEVIKNLSVNTTLENDWQKKSTAYLEFIGTQVDFGKPDGEVVQGIFRGIDETGKIEIHVEGNQPQLFASGHLSPRV